MSAIAIEELEIKFKDDLFYAKVEVEGKLTDESFSHEFGIQQEWGQEVIGAKLISCLDKDDKEVKDKEILDFVKKHIENEDFSNTEFDFSD